MPTECSICLDKIQLVDKKKKLKMCGHTYHKKCFNALADQTQCPTCRRLIATADEYKYMRKNNYVQMVSKFKTDEYRLCRLIIDYCDKPSRRDAVLDMISQNTELIARFIADNNTCVTNHILASNKINWYAKTLNGDTLIERGLKSAIKPNIERLIYDSMKTPSAPPLLT